MVQLALRRPYTFIVMAMLIVLATPFVLLRMATDIFPEINIPVVSRSSGTTPACRPRRWASASRARCERSLDHHRQRHRAHRIAVAGGRVDHQGFLPAHRQHRDGDLAGGGLDAGSGAAAAAGHHAAAGHQVLGLERAGDPARAVEPDALENSCSTPPSNQLRPQLITVPGAAIPFPLRRQEPPDLGRPRHPGAAGARPVAVGRGERDQHAEPDPALGHRQVRRHRVQRAHERLARCDRGPQRPADPHRERRHHLRARRGPRARRLLAPDQRGARRTACAACCCRCSRTAAPPRWTSSANLRAMLPQWRRRPCRRTSRSRRCSTSRCS